MENPKFVSNSSATISPCYKNRGYMANAAKKVRDVFKDAQTALTLANIKEALPELKANEISMALCYFLKQRYLTRVQVENASVRGRKKVWIYTFHEVRLPSPEPVIDAV